MQTPSIEVPGLQIPDRCRDCPRQCDLTSKYGKLQIIKLIAQSGAETLVGEGSDEFDKAILEYVGGDTEEAANLATNIRTNTAEYLNQVDERIEAMEEVSAIVARSCEGTLKMRATKLGITYTVAICTGATEYHVNSEPPDHVDAHVWVETSQQ